MEPDQFRESRLAINAICNKILKMLEEKNAEKAKTFHVQAKEQLDQLSPQAEGEVQERSVKNLDSKVNMLGMQIQKIKPGSSGSKSKKSASIVWDEERIASLSPNFLMKVIENMGTGEHATICFGTSGKGIRPNYQILLGPEKSMAYNGSSHKPLAKPMDAKAGKLSRPFARKIIEKALNTDPSVA